NENSIINKNIQELKIQLSKEKITEDKKDRINTLINKFNRKISNNKIEKNVIERKSIEPDEIKPPKFPKLEDKEKLDLEIDFICNKNPEFHKEFDKLRRTRRDHVKLYEQLLKEINNPNVKIDDLKHDKGSISKKINKLKNIELTKDLFEELYEKYNEKYTKLIADNTKEFAQELERQINEEKNSKNIDGSIKKN
ncbi:39203_t:CDS:2, partial [Gigaspora margarita]